MDEQIEEAKKGSKSAFTHLILSKQQDLYKIARSRLNQPADIDDAIQETMIIAYTKLRQLKDNSKFDFWLIKILVNQCNSIYRKRKKVVMLPYEDVANAQEASYQEPVDEKLQYEWIMSKLAYEDRTLAVLYYTLGYTTKQMSTILQMNENTIKTKLRRMKEKLRKIV